MKVSIIRSGGFAGITTKWECDPSQLTPEELQTLRSKVQEAGLSALPLKGATAQPDRFNYEVTIDDEGKTQTVQIGEENLTIGLRSLVDWVVARG